MLFIAAWQLHLSALHFIPHMRRVYVGWDVIDSVIDHAGWLHGMTPAVVQDVQAPSAVALGTEQVEHMEQRAKKGIP